MCACQFPKRIGWDRVAWHDPSLDEVGPKRKIREELVFTDHGQGPGDSKGHIERTPENGYRGELLLDEERGSKWGIKADKGTLEFVPGVQIGSAPRIKGNLTRLTGLRAINSAQGENIKYLYNYT